MAEPYIGEIRMFGGYYAPEYWALCDGKLLSIAEHTALYSLLNTYYGGDGVTTFALPDMRGRVPVHYGEGRGLTPRLLGQRFGTENVTITKETMLGHNHDFLASATPADKLTLDGNVLGTAPSTDNFYAPEKSGKQVNLIDSSVQTAGNGDSHVNMMPFTCINFIIALKGVYPERN